MSEPLRAISVRQPWARCIAVGAKLVENRSRPTSYRGLVAIHASRPPSLAGDRDERVLRLYGEDPRVGAPVGAVVAVVDLVDCHQASPVWPTCCQPWGDARYGDKAAWHLVLNDAVMLGQSVPCRGEVRVPWTLPDDVAVAVREQLGEVSGADRG